jgi:hypothetical protein
MLLAAAANHLLQGWVLVFSRSAEGTAPGGAFGAIGLHGWQLGAVLILAAISSLGAIACIGNGKGICMIAFAPEFVLYAAAFTGRLYWVWMGHYADGVVRPWEFILVDQMPGLMLGLGFYIGAIRFIWWRADGPL